MSPPILTGLSIPLSIDVSKDPQTVTFTVKTIDDNSGTNNVTINFDNSLYYYSGLNFGTSSSLNISVPVTSQSGVYNIASIVVSDNAGNDRVYNTLDLKNIEMPTSFVVTRDSIAPFLNSLSLPLIIDLGNSSQSVDFSVKATDDSTGISRVYMSLDKSLSYSSGSDSLSFGNQTNLSRVIPQYIKVYFPFV